MALNEKIFLSVKNPKKTEFKGFSDEKESSSSGIKLSSGEEKENLMEMSKRFIDDEEPKSGINVSRENEVKGSSFNFI